jgi:hypothetical protein
VRRPRGSCRHPAAAAAARAGAALLLAAVPAAAAECGGFLMSDSRRAAAFCDELNALLLAPHGGGTTERSLGDDDAELDRILRENPLLHEAWRSQPERTLDLIRRIRDAGGLAR